MAKYTVVSELHEMALRSDHTVTSNKLKDVPAGTPMQADGLWTASANGTSVRAGDVWAHIISLKGEPGSGWVAVKHLGVEYCRVQEDKSNPGRTDPQPVVDFANGLVTVRKWGDPFLYERDGMSTADIKVGNFQEVPLFHTLKNKPTHGEFNAITCFQELGKAELKILQQMQPDDQAKYGFSLKQKMNWLIGPPDLRPPGQIYWSEEVGWDHPALERFRFGTLVFGGQKVLVETDATGNKVEYRFNGKFRKREKSEQITFYKIVGMRKAEAGRPVEELLREGKVQVCTSANRSARGENLYTETLRGIVYNPVWSPLDYPSNYGNALYLAKDFCL